jgi:hypothetical protein
MTNLATLNFSIRPANEADLDGVMEFYQSNAGDTLPAPSYRALGAVLESGSLLLVVDDCGSYVAAAGTFQYIKAKGRHCLYELSGTRVTRRVGGLMPVRLQQILLAIRIVQLLATEGRDGARVSAISSAMSDGSIGNLRAMALDEIKKMPGWLEYDTYSWIRAAERPKWRHFIVGEPAARAAIEILERVEFGKGAFDCYRVRRAADDGIQHDNDDDATRQTIRLEYRLGLTAVFPKIVQAKNDNTYAINFWPIPSRV